MELMSSRLARINPHLFTNQSGASIEDGDEDELNEIEEETDLYDEPVDEDGDPTGEHDHHQDDNYALGGKVTRSGT
ncbi:MULTISPECIES: hypothetical protein [Larkinella]|jgi:hypothetical protein|uniref:Uncharacterized protein n=1 Tax=Larkinella humicola TaxID=2607654 RepID=A0A5N1JL54_9BACT|nr:MULTISPECIES: hypothetical protein [Larkinella]KAA9357215.1 hypothetical protein F0P93_05625 [Larkinella humicola]